MIDEQLDVHLDNILKASGSALKHYSMQKTKDDMRQALRQAIAELESQEPVAWRSYGKLQNGLMGWRFATDRSTFHDDKEQQPLYTHSPQRKPLTDEMAKQMKERCNSMEMRGAFADGWLSAEAAHGIKE